MTTPSPIDLLIRNGRMIDPSQNLDQVCEVLVRHGRVAAIGKPGEALQAAPDARIVDAKNCVVAPGFIDLHCHLREPGKEYAETIESGGRAAAAGGFTSVLSMPNTRPVNDSAALTRYIIETARKLSPVNVFPVGAITEGSKGEKLAPFAEMQEAGAVALTDDGLPVMNAGLMRHAMSYAASLDMTVIDHAEDLNLTGTGQMHEGYTATRLGLAGISGTSEDIMVSRDIILAGQTGAAYHVAHLSTAASLDLVRRAKQQGLRVTCEVTPHHFTLMDEDIRDYDTNYKMKPPLRSRADRDALLQGFADGTVDAIGTDHAPHAGSEKMQEFSAAPFGIIGLETALGLALDKLLHTGLITLNRLVELMAVSPARIAGLTRGTLKPGAVADITILDPERRWTYDVNQTCSRSKNSPFHGATMRGGPVMTIVAGNIVWNAERTPSV